MKDIGYGKGAYDPDTAEGFSFTARTLLRRDGAAAVHRPRTGARDQVEERRWSSRHQMRREKSRSSSEGEGRTRREAMGGGEGLRLLPASEVSRPSTSHSAFIAGPSSPSGRRRVSRRRPRLAAALWPPPACSRAVSATASIRELAGDDDLDRPRAGRGHHDGRPDAEELP